MAEPKIIGTTATGNLYLCKRCGKEIESKKILKQAPLCTECRKADKKRAETKKDIDELKIKMANEECFVQGYNEAINDIIFWVDHNVDWFVRASRLKKTLTRMKKIAKEDS